VHPALYKSAHSLGLFNKRLFFCVFSDFNEDELETLARSAGDSDYEKGDSGDDDDDDDGMKSSSDEKESGAGPRSSSNTRSQFSIDIDITCL